MKQTSALTNQLTQAQEVSDVDARNCQTELRQIRQLKEEHPKRLFLYVKNGQTGYEITTWPGTVVSSSVRMGDRSYTGFGHNTYRRSVRCVIFGVRYTGWYFESSGDYCRLKRAKA